MKAWKFVLAIGLAVIAVALICVSVFAYTGAQGFYSPYVTNAHDAYPNGMMGEAYCTPQVPLSPTLHHPHTHTSTSIRTSTATVAAADDTVGTAALDQPIKTRTAKCP